MAKRTWNRPLILVLTGVLGLTAFVLWNHNKVTVARFQKVHHRMPMNEVIQLLGPPTRQEQMKGYVDGPDRFILTYDPDPSRRGDHVEFPAYHWETDDVHVLILFNPEGRAITRRCQEKAKPIYAIPWYQAWLLRIKRSVGL